MTGTFLGRCVRHRETYLSRVSRGARFAATSCKLIAVCLVVSVYACGGSSERFNRRDPGGGGASAGSGVATGGSGGTAGSSVPGGSGGTAGTSDATGGSGVTGGIGGAGSGGATAGSGATAGGGGATAGSDAVGGSGGSAGAAHPSTIGCRDPEEPGCATCCEPDGSNCTERFMNRPASGYGFRSLEGLCPESCPRCAVCRISEESTLRNLGCRPDCDCVNLVIGVDPCINGPEECGCYCANAKRAGLFDCSFVCE